LFTGDDAKTTYEHLG
jgi:hypothetical protein